MRFAPVQLVLNQAMTADINSKGIDLNQTPLFSIQASWTGTPTGTIKLQASNDIVQVDPSNSNPVGPDPAGLVVNWSDIPSSSQAIAGAAGNFLWNQADVGYRWVRVVYTFASGTGTLSVTYSGKSV